MQTFGDPTECFGGDHADNMLRTYRGMQRQLFANKDGTSKSVTEHVKHLIEREFSVSDIPDSFLFLPGKLGGMNMKIPFVPSILVHNALYSEPIEYTEDLKAGE